MSPSPAVSFYPAGQMPPQMQPGDFMLVANRAKWWSRSGFVSACIRRGEYWRLRRTGMDKAMAWKLAHWSHAVAVGDGHLVEAEADGVDTAALNKYVDADFVYVATDLDSEERTDAAGFLEQATGDKYGFVTIACIAFRALTGGRLAFMAPKTYICSGLVAAMLGTWAWRGFPAWVMPADLALYHGITATTLPDL